MHKEKQREQSMYAPEKDIMGWISAVMEPRTLKSWAIVAVVGAVAMSTVLLIGMRAAQASHYGVSLEGSQFEIENATGTPLPAGANLKLDTPGLTYDWANVNDSRQTDKATGQTDDSFGNGTKEDTPVPSVTDGSIPNNKSDLLNFGVYLEKNTSGSFLHLFWHRVQEPTGTTNMDFEFNKSKTKSTNGTTPVRSEGDVLIQYDLSQGGTRPSLFLSRWYTAGNNHTKADCEAATSLPCWSKKVDLTASGDATGSINNVAITDDPNVTGDPTDGLATGGTISPRTFGEASINFDKLSSGSGTCTSFGSAYLKSRSSDSFTAALKDFIAPLNQDIGNCGKIVIDKVTNPSQDPTKFNFALSGGPTGSTINKTFQLADQDTPYDSGGIQPGTYSASENNIPAGWDLSNTKCTSTDSGDTSTISNISVSTGETVTCTFTNTKRGEIKVDKVTDPSGDPTPFDFSLTGGPTGSTVNQSFSLKDADPAYSSGAIKPGSGYNVAETVPGGWDQTSASCDKGETNVGNITVEPGETVTCTFNNTQQRGSIVIDKVTYPGNDPQRFDFALSGGPSSLNQSFQLADQTAAHNSGSVLAGSGYSASETVPAGWDQTGASCTSTESGDDSTVTNIKVSAGETVTCTFTNTKQGHILIDKVTDPSGDSQLFDFALSGGPSGLDQTFQLADQSLKHDSGAIKPGSGYSVSETVPSGWDQTSATCNDTNSIVTNIDVSPGETVTCTFNNAKKMTSISTVQRFVPQDTATISGSGTGTFNGQVDFELYKGASCATGDLVYYERNVTLPSSGTVGTSNGDVASANHSAYYVITSSGAYHWKVSYHNDTNGHPAASSCVEESSLTVDNDNTQP
ncbi:MAG: hypothetical protein H0V83_13205 [Rubrobacter sp.]|nr:hypothetical protein [Rubrobacter sp.]